MQGGLGITFREIGIPILQFIKFLLLLCFCTLYLACGMNMDICKSHHMSMCLVFQKIFTEYLPHVPAVQDLRRVVVSS